MVQFFVFFILRMLPATLDLAAWYALVVNLSAVLVALLVLAAFHISLGGRPLVGSGWLES